MDYVVTSSSLEDVVLAEMALKCRKKKQFGFCKKNKDKDKATSSEKDNVSHVPLDEDIINQAIVVTNLRNDCEKAYSIPVEEAKRTWDLGKKLGLYAENEQDVINALTDIHVVKEDSLKRAHARGKKGMNKRD